jgi:hypothetical protein
LAMFALLQLPTDLIELERSAQKVGRRRQPTRIQ